MSLLKTNEVATILRCSTPTVRRLIRDGELPAINVGSRKRIDSAHLVRFLRNDKGGSNAPTNDQSK